MDERLSDHDFAAAVRGLTKVETNEEALEILRSADAALASEFEAPGDLPSVEELSEGTRTVDPSKLPE